MVLRWVVPFLERYLRGAPRLQAFFETSAPPGVQVRSELWNRPEIAAHPLRHHHILAPAPRLR